MPNTVCVECNSEVPDLSEFCPECGFPAEAGTVSCPECLNPVLLTLDACPECGYPLERLRQPEVASPPAPSGDVPAEGAADEGAPVAQETAAAAAVEERVPLAKLEASEIDNPLLQAQIESLNRLTEAVSRMAENGPDRLVEKVSELVGAGEAGKNEMLSDLITSINRFVESSEQIKEQMLSTMKEQNLTVVSSMQEIVDTFSMDVKTAADGIKEAQKTALAEMNGMAQQIKAAATKEPEPPKSDGSDYVLYICFILLLFSSLNIIVTAYLVKLVK